MDKGLSSHAFAKLLDRLADDPEKAGEQYEDLRRTLIRFFEWRGASHAEDLTDEALNRIAGKLDAGVEIKNIGAYCHEVGRLVFLESLRTRERKGVALDTIEFEIAAEDRSEEDAEKERRMACLDECLRALPSDNRELITEYYKNDTRSGIEHRQALAARFGLRRDALANRAQRLRDKLEQCVKRCMRKDPLIRICVF